MSLDHYDILGCTKESTYDEIKRAYHSRALLFHPDKRTQESDSEKFQRILEAWRILGDSQLREEYDADCKQAELDSESILIYAVLRPNELEEATDDKDALVYRCRCGGVYRVQKQHLREKNCKIHVPCEECTFLVVVET